MSTEIKVPTLGESVTEATIAQWFKSVGDHVEEISVGLLCSRRKYKKETEGKI